MTLESAKAYFMKDQYAMKTSGIEILETGDRTAKCRMKLDERHMNAIGQVMGGAVFTLADFTFAVATNNEEIATVTVTSQISYLSIAKGTVLYSDAKILKDGKRSCFYEIEITDDLGTKVAVISTNGMHLPKK